MSLRAALIQTRTPASQGQALEHTAPLIEAAVRGGAQFILTPEGSNLLQRSRSAFEAVVQPEETDLFVAGVKDLARAHGVHILIGSALGFLGMGAQPPSPEWGAMIATARRFILDQWWVPTIPGIAIFVASLAFNLLGDGLRDVLDPKQR